MGNRRRRARPTRPITPKALAPAAVALGTASAGQARDISQTLATLTQATYGGYPFRGMPRNPEDRLPFGPLQPLVPDAIDPTRPDTGRTDPRLTQYPQAWNLPGSGERLIPWATLRGAADGVGIIRRCIEIRKSRIAGLKWSWNLRPEIVEQEFRAAGGAKGHDDIAAELREKWAPEINRLTEFWRHPWKAQGYDFKTWMRCVLEDRMVLDGVSIFPQVTYGGELLGLEVIDATTIKPLRDHRGARPVAPFPAYQQILYGFPRGEWRATASTDEDGNAFVDSGFLADQMIYLVENARTWTPYGFGPVEQSLVDARLYARRQGWMMSEYDDGSMPEGVIESPETLALTPKERRDYESAMNDELAGQTQARHRVKFLFPGTKMNYLPDVAERYKAEYDLFLIKLVSSHFGVPASELGFTETRGLGGTGMHQAMKESQDDSATQPDIAFTEDLVNSTSRALLRAPLELAFEFNDADGESEKDADAIAQARVARGSITLNDDRRRLGLPAYTFEEADKPYVAGASGPVFLEGSAQAQADAAAASAQAKANPPPGGPQDDAQPVDDGPPPKPGDDAAKAAEMAAYRNYVRKGRGRPFRWEHHTADEVAELTKADTPGKAQPAPGEAVPPPDHRWPAWAVDTALASAVAAQLRASMLQFLPLADQFTEWSAGHPGGLTADAVTSWLRSQGVSITPAIQGAVRSAIVQGYLVGARSAEAVLAAGDVRASAATAVDWAGWRPGDLGAARRVLSADGRTVGLQALLDDAGTRIESIAAGRLDEVAAVLADGLERGETPKAIATALRGVLDDPDWAMMTAWTETNRAQSAAAMDTYRLADVGTKEWFTANDQRVCPICAENEAEGDIPLGQAFASGDQHPPGHPRCRCAVIPGAEPDDADKVVEADLAKVGPKGYEHGWIFVGVPGAGQAVHHPRHGAGHITHAENGRVHVRFESGREHSFEASTRAAPGDFVRRDVSGGHAARVEAYRRRQLARAAEERVKAEAEPVGSVHHNIAVSRAAMYADRAARAEHYVTAAEKRKAVEPDVAMAAGRHDIAEEGHEYWTRGKGLARWIGSPHPWTKLYHLLLRHIGDPDEAKRTASQWFHDVTGIWPGERKGKNPVGRG